MKLRTDEKKKKGNEIWIKKAKVRISQHWDIAIVPAGPNIASSFCALCVYTSNIRWYKQRTTSVFQIHRSGKLKRLNTGNNTTI